MAIQILTAADDKKGAPRDTPGRSGISSPYFDLAASLAVADAIYKTGGGTCTSEQLTVWLGYKSANSGTYLTRVSAANKHFGFIDSSGDTYTVTERAKKILAPVMPEDAVNAKIEAFLAVPLFLKVYESFKGNSLPPEVGLKNLFLHNYKILPDRVAQSVRVFLNSAEQAGFFSATGDRSRLVRPTAPVATNSVVEREDETPPPAEKQKSGGGGGSASPNDSGTGGVDTAIIGLLRKLPMQGATWTKSEQARFLTAFTHTVQFLYPTVDGDSA